MRKLFIFSLLAFSVHISAQDAFFTQTNFGWSMINPAYAGSLACARAEIGYRNQWPRISGNFITWNAAYDQYTRYGGLGFNYTLDLAGMGTITDNRFDFNYSYPLQIGTADDGKAKLVIQPGVQASYYRKGVDWDELNFGDEIDPRRGFVYNTTETPTTNARHLFDVSAGVLAYTKRLCVGFSTFHLTEPNEGFIGVAKRPMRFVIHASGVIGNADPNEKRLSLIPSVLFMQQGNSQMLVGMLTAKYFGAGLGVGFRNEDAMLFTASYTWRDFTLAYSYDYTVSSLTNYTGGSHEAHFAYRFLKDQWSAQRRNLQAF